MSGVWQLIETAPKGEAILAWTPLFGGKVVLASWKTDHNARKPRPYWSFSDERLWGVANVRARQPTHWIPLPSRPEADNEGTQEETP